MAGMRSRNKVEGGSSNGGSSSLPSFVSTSKSPSNASFGSLSSPNRRKRSRQSLFEDRIRVCVPITAIAVLFIVSFQLVLNSILSHHDGTSNKEWTDLQQQIAQLQHQISQLEQQQPILPSSNDNNPQFLPFVIRDARHLVPTQPSHEFHLFDYVDTTAPQQVHSRFSHLYHNARPLDQAPCQKYSVECYRLKILQVFRYVLEHFPQTQYYFYMEADNDLCVPMSMVRNLALTEKRYFINVGIGFSGWIMSRQFLQDFYDMYSNITIPLAPAIQKLRKDNQTAAEVEDMPEIRPDVLASYY